MSTTPRTDDAKNQYLTGKIGVFEVLNEAHKLETELAHLNAEVERLKFYIATTIQPDEYAKVIKDLRAEVGRLLERIDGERGYSIEVENERQVLQEKVSELEDNLDVARHRLDEAEGDAEQMEKDLNFKISELEDLLAEAVEERK